MEITTVRPLAAILVDTLSTLIEIGVVLELFPAVTLRAVHVERTPSLLVAAYLAGHVPLLADFGLVFMFERVSSKVLYVVGVLAARFIVLVVKGAVHRLVLVHEEVHVLGLQVQPFDLELVHMVGEATERPVTTILDILSVVGTEFCLILLGMVELLYCIMAEVAGVPLRAGIPSDERTQLWLVVDFAEVSSLVLEGVVEWALFVVVVSLDVALHHLEALHIHLGWLRQPLGQAGLLDQPCGREEEHLLLGELLREVEGGWLHVEEEAKRVLGGQGRQLALWQDRELVEARKGEEVGVGGLIGRLGVHSVPRLRLLLNYSGPGGPQQVDSEINTTKFI